MCGWLSSISFAVNYLPWNWTDAEGREREREKDATVIFIRCP